ncbi:MAG TPA: hypothetical protein PKK12_01085 [Candidatus Aminicenantes bacterium]|nr:hypothetical protein [Candidatus Aminicenantes bacterium]
MSTTHRIFGLSVRSVLSLPAPDLESIGGEPDVEIALGTVPETLSDAKASGLRYWSRPGEFLLRVDGVARYHVQDGRRITIAPEPGVNTNDLLVFLMGSTMGALLHQRGILALHAGAIEANGKAILFCGKSGIGKSTLTAGFHRRGHPFLADDVCAVTMSPEGPLVLPGFSRLKLWADTLKKLDSNVNGLGSMRWRDGLEKYFLPVESSHDRPIPVGAIFLLSDTNSDRLEVVELKGMEKVPPLINQTYRFRFLEGQGGKDGHFAQCTAVARHAPLFRVVRPRKGFQLNCLMDLIVAHFPA